MTGAQFETWLRGTSLAPAGDGATVLSVRTTWQKEMLETRFRERIEAAIRDVTGAACALRIVVGLTASLTADTAEDEEKVAVAVESRPEAHNQLAGVQMRRNARQGEPPAAPSLFDAPVLASSQEHAPQPGRAGASRPLSAPRRADLQRGVADTGMALPRPGRTPLLAERGRAGQSLPSMAPAPEADHAAAPAASFLAASGLRGEQRVEVGGAMSMGGYGDPPVARHDGPSGPLQGGQPRLNPRYTFSTFIVGSGNQLAHAASQAVADAPGFAYNPLFLYGGVGLGKTHLLHAIGHSGLEKSLTVLYVSSETFTNDIVNAIRYRTTEEFRAKYRSVDVLLVDDIQFIAGKDSTEEEFFHTFNALHEMNKQIVICSDRPPKAIVSLEERLRSRFEWGLIADIQPPDLETRVAILRAKADMLGRVVPDEAIQYLASRVQSNIRELEGSFNRLLAFAQLQRQPLTIDTAKAALASLASDSRQKRVTIGEILEAIAEYYRIPIEDLCGKQRDKHIVVPRQVAMYLMRQETEASLLEIGQALGGRDHSTVLHGYDKISREINDNTALRKEVLAIRQQLLG